MKRHTFKRGAAILGCAASLAGTTVALAPGVSAAAPAAKSCGSKIVSTPVKGAKGSQVAASRIRVEGGATCAEAYAVIAGVATKKLPKGWTVAHGNFKVPKGLIPQVAVNGKKKVLFALPGNDG